jgi:CRP-like cAMP-binding protein
MFNFSDKEKVLDFLKAGMSFAEAGQCYGSNESSF